MRMRRGGFSLVELLVVSILGAITLAAVYQMLVVQQRGYSQQSARIDAQSTGRVALQVLATELREVSPTGSDLLRAESSVLTIRAVRKVGIVCAVDGTGPSVDVWVLGAEPFAVADSILLFADGNVLSTSDDAWLTVAVQDVAGGTCTPSWGTMDPQKLTIELPNPTMIPISSVQRGGVVRSFRTLTYGIYEDGDDWVLGRRTPGGPVVPLLGGLAPRDAGGLQFRYFRSTGTQFDPTTQLLRDSIARIEIHVGTRSRARVGADREFYRDSLVTQIYLRNGG